MTVKLFTFTGANADGKSFPYERACFDGTGWPWMTITKETYDEIVSRYDLDDEVLWEGGAVYYDADSFTDGKFNSPTVEFSMDDEYLSVRHSCPELCNRQWRKCSSPIKFNFVEGKTYDGVAIIFDKKLSTWNGWHNVMVTLETFDKISKDWGADDTGKIDCLADNYKDWFELRTQADDGCSSCKDGLISLGFCYTTIIEDESLELLREKGELMTRAELEKAIFGGATND